MSYRHSSYRKMSAAVLKANRGEELTRAEMNRVLHWSRMDSLPKSPGWGRPKAKRAARV
jgi:hypothetical protein